MNIPEYRILQKYGHYEAVDSFGRFVCSGDTFDEVANDIVTMIKNMVGGVQDNIESKKHDVEYTGSVVYDVFPLAVH